jgi:hypothetical protein
MANLNTSEIRLFSSYSEDIGWNKALMEGSVSIKDAQYRKDVYSKVFSRFNETKEYHKMFSGYSEIPLLSNQYFNATMASYVRSFAGFLSIERDMDQPTALLWFMDLLGVTDNRIILPNVGQENLDNINARFQTQQTFDPGRLDYIISTNKKLIPRSVELNLAHALEPTKIVTIKDDGSGNLLAPAGILTANAGDIAGVDYQNGVIRFTLGSGFTVESGDNFSVIGYEDVAGSPDFGTLVSGGNNRFKMDKKSIQVTSEPDMIIAENNLMAIAAMQKAIGVSPQDVSGAKLTELYTKLVNQKLVKAIQDSWVGNTYMIDTASFISGPDRFLDFSSRLDAFQAELINIDTELAMKSVKGVNATAYIVGENMANWFRKLVNTNNFVDNVGSSYINDLVGYYKGIPVLRHTDIKSNEGYAIHKTNDGQLAPLIRGIFLPLTNTPLIGNYNNPSQFANGIYYQEANKPIVPELIMKFQVNK